MKFINIYPINNLEQYETQEMNMFLTHLVLKYPEYKEMARQHNGYKILDNSLIEMGESMDFDLVLEAAELIEADEVVLPDSFRNGSETVSMAKKILEEYRDRLRNYKVMAVVHGTTIEEWSDCLTRLNDMEGIDVLGIPKVLEKDFYDLGGRPFFANKYLQNTRKEIHLLGLYFSIEELTRYKYLRDIRSLDTSLMALNDVLEKDMNNIRHDGEIIDLEKNQIVKHRTHREVHKYVEWIVSKV